jgi:hypothetical protein
MIANPEVVDLGDARNFTEVWNSAEMRAFRQLHIAGEIPDVCKTCYAAKKPA